MGRESIVIYRSFLEASRELAPKDFKAAMIAIMEYGMDGKMPSITGTAKAIFLMAKPQVDANNARYENGCKGGRPPKKTSSKTKKEPKQNQMKPNETKPEPNVHDNVHDNDNELFNPLSKESVSNNKGTPTLEEISEYVRSSGSSVDAKRFFDYQRARGWMINGSKIVDWRAAVDSWKPDQKKEKETRNKFNNFHQREYDFDRLEQSLLQRQVAE